MPLDSDAFVSTCRAFRAMGTTNVVAVDDPDALAPATAAARAVIRAVDDACSRFRADSEISMLNKLGRERAGPVSELLDDVIGNALRAAAATDGLVDPTVGGLMERIGYTVTLSTCPWTVPQSISRSAQRQDGQASSTIASTVR